MELKKIICSSKNGIGIIQMNYLKNLNAIDEEMADELLYALEQYENDGNVKILILKGGEKAFSAGGDIGYFYNKLSEGGDINMDSLIEKAGKVSEKMRSLSKLIITSVSGAAAGAGANLALSGDFVIVAENAKFIQAFVNLGLVPDTGGSFILAKSIGTHRAMELCISGRPMKAEEAKELGLVYKIVPVEELENEAMALAEKLAKGPLISYKNIKKQIYAASYKDYKDYLMNTEVPTQRECISSCDFKEGVKAFVEKRKPEFKGN